MTLSATTVWEVRTGGSDTNGGGFNSAAAGTDWSQQNAAQYSVTDGVANGTTTITSATANFGSDVVGNIIYVSGGTGSITAGWYEITTRNSSSSITVDRATGLTAGTGVTLKIGGAFATIATATIQMTVAGMQTWIKAGTYQISSGIIFPDNPGSNGFVAMNKVEGYNSVRGDRSTKPLIQATAAITMFTGGLYGGHWLINLEIDGNNTANNGVYYINSSYSNIGECKIHRMLNYAIKYDHTGILTQCEVTGCGGATDSCAVNLAGGPDMVATYNYIHDNTTTGILHSSAGGVIINNIVINNSGSTSDGIVINYIDVVKNNISYNNGRHGIRIVNSFPGLLGNIDNNLLISNGGYGIYIDAPVTSIFSIGVRSNAFYNNTSGPRANVTVQPGDITLNGDPFVNAAAGDFSLNNILSRGAACKRAGFPGTMPVGLTVGYMDIGIQHAGGNKLMSQSVLIG